MDTKKPLFREINADDPDPEATEIDSLCMNCHETVSAYEKLTSNNVVLLKLLHYL